MSIEPKDGESMTGDADPASVRASRREVLLGAGAGAATLAAAPLMGLWSHGAGAATPGYDPSMSVNLGSEELAKYRNPALLKHLFSAKPLVNRERAYEVMDKHGLHALVACTPKNVYYLSSHDNAFYHTGIEHMLFAVLPRREDAPPGLIIWGALLYHLDYRPTWMPSVQIFTAPAPLERFAGSGALPSEQRLTGQEPADLMKGDPPAMRYNRNLVRKGAKLSQRDLFQLALAAEYADKPAASALHALKRTLLAAGVGKGRVGFDDARVIPWMKDVGLDGLAGVDASDIFKEVRMVKSANEVELLREVSRRCESALDAAIASLHVGQAISDVEVEYRKRIGALGGDTRWLIINQDGLNSGRIERDKVIKIDSVGDYLGYVGDIGRSVVVGNPTDETVGRNEANGKALSAAYRAIRPGMPFEEVSRIVGDVMHQEGYNGFAAAHNVGIDHTDQPNSLANPVRRPEPLKFAEGTVFTIDVPYLEVGYGSSHVEDMMVCTKTGAVPLSSGDVKLRVRKA
jgi:Xaa-Pro aminopeptidase